MPASSIRSSKLMPFHRVSNLDHLVTQWMSVVRSEERSAVNSFQLHLPRLDPSVSWMVNVHSSSGVCGVGPAESTGKSEVRYWPGGSRDRSRALPRPWKPRVAMGPLVLGAAVRVKPAWRLRDWSGVES